MNWKACNDVKRNIFRLIANVALGRNYDFDRAHCAAPHAKTPLHHTLSIPAIRIDAANTEISHKFYLRFFFIGHNVFIARTRSLQRLASFFFLNGFDGSACFTSYIEQVYWKLTYQCSLQYVAGSIVAVTSVSISSNTVVSAIYVWKVIQNIRQLYL